MSKDKLTYRLISKDNLVHGLRNWQNMLILNYSHRKIVDKESWAIIREEAIKSEVIKELCK